MNYRGSFPQEYVDLPAAKKTAKRDTRRKIEIQKGRLAEIVDKAEQALLEANINIFTRGDELVCVVEKTETSAANRSFEGPVGTPKVVRQTTVTLADLLNRTVLFLKPAGQEGFLQPADCPNSVAETLLSRVGGWKFPPLKAVINAPTMLSDGTILSRPGYDEKTGLFLGGSMELPPIPEKPTRAEALAALAVVGGLLDEFPFVSDTHRSAALAMLLTAIIRPTLPTAPMFGITAPTPGTGKSYLADIAAALATGSKAAVVAADCDEEELDKRLSSSLMASDQVLNLDNVNHPLRSSFLCQSLSQERVKCRILGRSANVNLPTNALMIATGNALAVYGDLTRRVLLIELDSREERPELRKFKRDPVAEAIANRPRYIAAALTIMRAFITSGEAMDILPLASFSDWSQRVREPLVWLDLPDPIQAMEAARQTDPEKERTAEILAALQKERVWTVKEIERRLGSGSADALDLRDALAGFFKHGQFEKHAFGNWCRKHKDRPVEGMRLVQAGYDAKAKVSRWHVETVHQGIAP